MVPTMTKSRSNQPRIRYKHPAKDCPVVGNEELKALRTKESLFSAAIFVCWPYMPQAILFCRNAGGSEIMSSSGLTFLSGTWRRAQPGHERSSIRKAT